ncbi:flagellar hook-basal body complex protein [Oceanimonas pelagia]|nr:flagellar hook-basal body complex protein [Oceanimonas pelagia]
MSFNIALSGINAAQKDLDVTANNIANVNTYGFKESRAEFADVYSNSIFANARTQTGNGVQTAAVSQQFHEGASLYTNNPLDMRISGQGFFVVGDELNSSQYTLTRAGAFKLNNQNYVTNSQGQYLRVYNVDAQTGGVSNLGLGETTPLRIPQAAGAPEATRNITTSLNLDKGSKYLTASGTSAILAGTQVLPPSRQSSASVTLNDAPVFPLTINTGGVTLEVTAASYRPWQGESQPSRTTITLPEGTYSTLSQVESAINLALKNTAPQAGQVALATDANGKLQIASRTKGEGAYIDVSLPTELGSGANSQWIDNGTRDYSTNNLTFNISVDGTPNVAVTLDKNYQSNANGLDGMLKDIESKINSALAPYEKKVAVALDANGQLSITSQSQGSESSLSLSADTTGTPSPASLLAELGLANNSSVMGSDAVLDITDSKTYSNSTTITIYDSLGQPRQATMYLTKRSMPENSWNATLTVDGKPISVPGGGVDTTVTYPNPLDSSKRLDHQVEGFVVTFDNKGGNPTFSVDPLQTETLENAGIPADGADPSQQFTLAFDELTQYASPFEVLAMEQDGNTVGYLTSLDINEDGLVVASYSNASKEYLGRVAVARVPNEQGLRSVGGTGWIPTQESGEPVGGKPNEGPNGRILSATLEQSNTNLTSELVDLITAQRNFQANSRALEVNSTLQQTILQIR